MTDIDIFTQLVTHYLGRDLDATLYASFRTLIRNWIHNGKTFRMEAHTDTQADDTLKNTGASSVLWIEGPSLTHPKSIHIKHKNGNMDNLHPLLMADGALMPLTEPPPALNCPKCNAHRKWMNTYCPNVWHNKD